jgi:hypothetical protein
MDRLKVLMLSALSLQIASGDGKCARSILLVRGCLVLNHDPQRLKRWTSGKIIVPYPSLPSAVRVDYMESLHRISILKYRGVDGSLIASTGTPSRLQKSPFFDSTEIMGKDEGAARAP